LRFCAGPMRPALHVMRRFAVNRDWFRIPELREGLGRHLGLVHFDRQLAELGGECAPVTLD